MLRSSTPNYELSETSSATHTIPKLTKDEEDFKEVDFEVTKNSVTVGEFCPEVKNSYWQRTSDISMILSDCSGHQATNQAQYPLPGLKLYSLTYLNAKGYPYIEQIELPDELKTSCV